MRLESAPVDRLTEPLVFERLFLEKVWGGRSLERCLGLSLPADLPVGETWEVVDRPGENSRVRLGPHAGRTLGELLRAHREDLLGTSPATPEGRFPLLVKYLDAQEALSVQVHPDDAGAARLGGAAEAKTEAWYFLDATADGAVWCGLRAGVDAEALADAMGKAALVEMLERFPVAPGTALTVRGGTIHAIGAGVTLLEVQQNSDTTYRLYDWDRLGLDGVPRAMHTEQGLAATRVEPAPERPREPHFEPLGPGARIASMARTEHFAMDRIEFDRPLRRQTEQRFRLFAAVEGAGALEVAGAGGLELEVGDVALVPAAAREVVLTPRHGQAGWVELHMPSRHDLKDSKPR
jgi:mannose-6-phosphate isomerase